MTRTRSRRSKKLNTKSLATQPPVDDVEVLELNEGAPSQESPNSHMRRWSAGQTTQENARFFARNTRGPAAINFDCVQRLDTLISNCRNEISRSPILQGVIDLDTTLLVGEHGPRIDIVCDARGGDVWASEAEDIINEWTLECDIAGERQFVDYLTAIARGLWSDGCGLIEERTARDTSTPVTMRLALHDPLYLCTPPDLMADKQTVMGVQVNDDGRPVRYHVGQIVDRTYDQVAWLESSPRPADLIYHVVDHAHMEPSQLRGVPYAASTLEASAQLRKIDKAILDALETAAKMNIALTTKDSKLITKSKILRGTLMLDRSGAATAIPPGYEANQIASAHPHQKYLELAESQLGQIGRPVSMPVTMVIGSFRSATFSAGRMDGGMHSRSVTRRRGVIKRRFIDPSLRVVVTEAVRARAIAPPPGRWSIALTWPSATIQPDPSKHYLAQQIAIANGTLSESQACAENGYTLESVIRQRVRDRDMYLRAGLPVPAYLRAEASGITPEILDRILAVLEANEE